MRRDEVTKELLGRALRRLRGRRTQKEVSERVADLKREACRPIGLLEIKDLQHGQISDYELGKVVPSLENLTSFLSACSRDGSVDFRALQEALEGEAREDIHEPLLESLLAEPMPPAMREKFDELTERLRHQESQAAEMAELQRRVAAYERELGKIQRQLGREGA